MATPREGSVAGGSKAAVAPATRISSSQKELHFEAGCKKVQFLAENDAHHGKTVKPLIVVNNTCMSTNCITASEHV